MLFKLLFLKEQRFLNLRVLGMNIIMTGKEFKGKGNGKRGEGEDQEKFRSFY